MKIFYCVLTLAFCMVALALAQEKGLLLDDFEGQILGGPDGTVDFGAGNGSTVEVTASSDIKHSGEQSLKVTYDAEVSGYIYVARGIDLDAKNAGWLVKPQDIDWPGFKALAFYMYGSDSKTKIAFDIKDNGNEMWRFIFEDNFKGWKQIICPFGEFFCRGDWQPANADKNATLDFPIKSLQFEPLPDAEAKKGVLYFDTLELLK